MARARIGLLSDNRGLYVRLTSRENVRYFGRLHGLEAEALERRIDALVKMLDMGDIADRRVEGFSLGQKLKVAIARALVHDPPNVLLDEPTAGLDVMTTRAMRDVVMRLRGEGKCVVLSSHVMQEVARLADRVVVVARGRVRVDATPDELRAQTGRENLEDAFVAALGSDEGVLA
jgi:sodium transport system ATP-binding protein